MFQLIVSCLSEALGGGTFPDRGLGPLRDAVNSQFARFRCSIGLFRGFKEEYVQHGTASDFEKIRVFLLGQADVPYAELARDMGATEGGVKVAIHRLRKQ
jgi:hypothetical protein